MFRTVSPICASQLLSAVHYLGSILLYRKYVQYIERPYLSQSIYSSIRICTYSSDRNNRQFVRKITRNKYRSDDKVLLIDIKFQNLLDVLKYGRLMLYFEQFCPRFVPSAVGTLNGTIRTELIMSVLLGVLEPLTLRSFKKNASSTTNNQVTLLVH